MDSVGQVEEILNRLTGIKKTANGWTAKCPAHEDRHSSLSIGLGDDGRILLKCFAGCDTKKVIEALGLTLKDLFPSSESNGKHPPRKRATAQRSPGLTLKAYAEAKKLDIGLLRAAHVTEIRLRNTPHLRILYRDREGQEGAVRFRGALFGEGKFFWRKGSKPMPYGLWRLSGKDRIALVEGESDCHTLWQHGEAAIGIPGANSWREEWAGFLDGIAVIYVVIERDNGGEAVKRWLSTSRIRERVRLVDLAQFKDPSQLHVAEPEKFKEQWSAALNRAVPFSEVAAFQRSVARDDAWKQCKPLAESPEILFRFTEALSARGVAGELRAAKVLYLAVISRLLDRPVSIAVKGPSSAGKSFIVEQILKFFPETSYYAVSAISERALAYSTEPLAHRSLVIYEAAGLRGEFASYMVRSLLSEGCVRYETVEKTKNGLRPRLIEREGPTGLIVTTTAVSLHPENETRLLSLPVQDDRIQTKQILLAIADETRPTWDATEWHALQRWLESGETRVSIPFATDLAKNIPPVAVRLRRDFGTILSLIRAHALLHQANRQRDTQGKIFANMADYEAVRELIGDLVSDGVEATVPKTVRETVGAVASLPGANDTGVSLAAIAQKLGLDKGPTSRRVAVAVRLGYLKNLEDRRGRPARIVIGELLPQELEILPSPQFMQEFQAFE